MSHHHQTARTPMRRMGLTTLLVGIGLLVSQATAHAGDKILRQVYKSVNLTWCITSVAAFNTDALTGVGTELLPLTSFTFVHSQRGFVQAARIIPSTAPYPPGTLLAAYENGLFDRLVSAAAGRIAVDPPSNAFGEDIILVFGTTPSVYDFLDIPCCAGEIKFHLVTLEGPCDAGDSAAVFRNAGSNPASYTTSSPVLGSTWFASVDLTTTGHSFAEIYGFTTPVATTLPGGQVLLIGGAIVFRLPAMAGPTPVWSVPIPNDCSLLGFTVHTQALQFGGPTPFALSNAQDLVVGN